MKLDTESVSCFGNNKCILDKDEQIPENEGENNDQAEAEIHDTGSRCNKRR